MTSRRQKDRLNHFCLGNVRLDIFLKTVFMYTMPIPVQTKLHFKKFAISCCDV